MLSSWIITVNIFIMTAQTTFSKAQISIPGGVNSPVRSFAAVDGAPVYIQSAQGAYLQDTENRQYVDYVNGFGPHVLGHSHPDIVHAICHTAKKMCSVGACHNDEIAMAELLIDSVPSIDMVRLTNSGTEAVMSALRLAKAVTGRSHIVKFTGGYHGHVDSMLVDAGSGATTFGHPSSPGVHADEAKKTLLADYNDLRSVDRLLSAYADSVAAIIVEPVAGNMGLIPPSPGFLEGLRQRTTKHGIVLIFDEVMTGFRVAFGGAQSLYGVVPDLTILGKVIGGGLPVGAVGGHKSLMQAFAPSGPVYQAGTLSGNPLTVAAGLACLRFCQAQQHSLYAHLQHQSNALTQGMQELAKTHNIPLQTTCVGGMFGFFFTNDVVSNYHDVKACSSELFRQFFHTCLQQGVYFAPSAYEAGFVSLAHDQHTLAHTLDCVGNAFAIIKSALKRASTLTDTA